MVVKRMDPFDLASVFYGKNENRRGVHEVHGAKYDGRRAWCTRCCIFAAACVVYAMGCVCVCHCVLCARSDVLVPQRESTVFSYLYCTNVLGYCTFCISSGDDSSYDVVFSEKVFDICAKGNGVHNHNTSSRNTCTCHSPNGQW